MVLGVPILKHFRVSTFHTMPIIYVSIYLICWPVTCLKVVPCMFTKSVSYVSFKVNSVIIRDA